MKIHPQHWRHLELRAHELLSDAPLHDVWKISLPGDAGGRNAVDLLKLLSLDALKKLSPAVEGLVRLRYALGRAFGWDEESDGTPEGSYLHRLSERDHARSLIPPGTKLPEMPGFRLLYLTQREAVLEIINATVHAFICIAFDHALAGSSAYLAVYVRNVSRWTPMYLALIDPFRKLLVYPAMIRGIKRSWEETAPSFFGSADQLHSVS